MILHVYLLKLINYKGYTKSSFSKIVDISRPTLDKIIGGEIDNSTTFKTHVEKILNAFNINLVQLINFEYEENKNDKRIVASNNAPEGYQMSKTAKNIFEIIDNLVDICEIYGK
jgi:predicted transcriptional regulator